MKQYILFTILTLTQLNCEAKSWRPPWNTIQCNSIKYNNNKPFKITIRECMFVRLCESVELDNNNKVIKAKNCPCGYSGEMYQVNTLKHKEQLEVEHFFAWSKIRDVYSTTKDKQILIEMYNDIDNLTLIGKGVNRRKLNFMNNLDKIQGINKGVARMIYKSNCNFCNKWKAKGLMKNCEKLEGCF